MFMAPEPLLRHLVRAFILPALLVNPYDTEGTATAIQMALQMPLEERRTRHHALLATCRQFDVHWWCNSFLGALREAQAQESGTPWLRL